MEWQEIWPSHFLYFVYFKRDADRKYLSSQNWKAINELHQLRIKLLENVKDAKEVCRAKLYDKRNLTDLSLKWGEIRNILDPDLDEKVLDSL
ncbi:hypothetical protein IEQ34_007912 [Dendrobium chrysotoxum]|uniref:R13L1/DRL21-like LRR repeat region domain-containing protein n=1 Tax=Dendrobium chrysotoxum TaxID=161865 RepID=A0AAV7H5M3_DENCH|nr:hypothetical protein IEQ34_007912 [Dendrobium chrysotoxum]